MEGVSEESFPSVETSKCVAGQGPEHFIRDGGKESWGTRRTQNGKDGSEAVLYTCNISPKSIGHYSLFEK